MDGRGVGTSAPEPSQTPGPGAPLRGSLGSRLVTGALPGPVPLSQGARGGVLGGGQGLVPGPPPRRGESPRESVGGEDWVPTAPFHMKTMGRAGWEQTACLFGGLDNPAPTRPRASVLKSTAHSARLSC